ncbi:MAG TPA: nodulation protein NfeD [Azonexus sp.]|nr:nodulation protein NfeD [Azonexus sp.]
MWRAVVLMLWLASVSASWAGAPPVVLLSIDGAIGPATADYVRRGIEYGTRSGAQLVVLQIDTPGGLDVSMRAMIKDILGAALPVAVYVAPSGARAASAGTYLLYAAHLAAMAPATNLGAATPVQIGGGTTPDEANPAKPAANDKDKPTDKGGAMARKQVNDAAAYIRGLAQLRGRNGEWAEQAVRQAVSLSAKEALRLKVIDVIAADLADLLKQLDGRKVTTTAGERTLATAGAAIDSRAPDWRTRFLSIITDPSLAYVLVVVGIYALMFEFSTPGLVLPGVAGAICVLTALYAFHLLPVNYAGLALILLGIGFMAAEAVVPAYGSLGIGGLIAFVIGSVILIDTDLPSYGIPLALIGGIAVASLAFLLLVAGVVFKSRHRPLVSGRDAFIGRSGEVLDDCTDEGWANIGGETWRVHCAVPLKAGQRVRVTGMRGLQLDVVPEAAKGE